MSYICDSETELLLRSYASMLVTFLQKFSWLSDAYVLDFFTDSHWHKLPDSWQHVLSTMDLNEVFNFMSPKSKPFKTLLPLSLLAFRRTTFALTWPRSLVKEDEAEDCLRKLTSGAGPAHLEKAFSKSGTRLGLWKSAAGGQHEQLDHVFRRHVKPKKQHEIFRCGEVVDIVCSACRCSHVLDIGSGQGHLSRFLSFKFGLNVTSVEGNGCHVSGAEKFDSQTLNNLQKKKKKEGQHDLDIKSVNGVFAQSWHPPKHINYFLSPTSDRRELLEVLSYESNDGTEMPCLAVLGLHTCGNLASTMLRLYAETPEICAILSVGCCYMKLDSEGFPLSNLDSKFSLSYEAKEFSCHALEQYLERVKDGGDSLKIHCYRATLEVLIQKFYPELKHLGLRSIKHYSTMTFAEYASKALSKHDIKIPSEEFQSASVSKCLDSWKQVLIFYSLRLMVAPLVESFILLDRMFYLLERGYASCLIPIFDADISPRNQMLISVKSKK